MAATPLRQSVKRPAQRDPNLTDVVSRLGTASFGVWVVMAVASSPVSSQRPWWWQMFIGLGALIGAAMLVGAFMTLRLYLRER